MGGQISKEDQNDHMVDLSEVNKRESEINKPYIIKEQFTLNRRKEQVKVNKNLSQIKIGQHVSSEIKIIDPKTQSVIDNLKLEKSEQFSESNQIQQPSGSIIISQIKKNEQQKQQNIFSNNQSRIFMKNAPQKINDPNFEIQNHFPEWANKMIQEYGQYQCPEKIDRDKNLEAILKYQDGSYYQGQIDGDYKHGYGIYLQEFSIFEGQFEKNRRHGWGREIQQDILNQGIWNDDKIVDKLEMRKQDEYYKGESQDGLPHGKGIMENKEYIYEGYFKNGLKNGKGFLRYKMKKDYYDGYFKNDKIEGKGKYYFANNVIYDGEFKEDQITGKGEMKYPNNKFYRGDFLNGKMDGYGLLQTELGTQHEGYFKEGRKHGYGKTLQNGIEIAGEWQDDVLKEEEDSDE